MPVLFLLKIFWNVCLFSCLLRLIYVSGLQKQIGGQSVERAV